MPKVQYVPLRSPYAPFFFEGGYYTRDEMIIMGMDDECHQAILEYTI